MREDQTKRYANPTVVSPPKPPGLENAVDGSENTPKTVPFGPAAIHNGGVASTNTRSQFEHQLAALVNKFSLENGTNTPDFILARYLVEALSAYEHAVRATHGWYRDSKWHNPNPTTSDF